MTAPYTLINSLDNKKKQKDFDQDLADWIKQQARLLWIDESEQHSYEGHQITLTCGGTHPQWNGSVGRIPEYPKDVRTLQKEAFDKAIEHGLVKLPKYKRKPYEGFKTVLLLEDVAGFNHQQIMDGLTSSDKARIDESIDYIVVLPSIENEMIVGYVWKEEEIWHRSIPGNRRLEL